MHNAKDLPQNFVPWNPEPVRDDFERLKFFPTKKGETNSFLDKIAKKALKENERKTKKELKRTRKKTRLKNYI